MSSTFTTRRFSTGGLLLLVLGILPAACGQGTGTATQVLTAAINPIAKVTVGPSVVLTPGASKFAPFQASLSISYWVRTTAGGTGGTVTARVTSDFTPAGGPSAASGALSYTCTGQTYGTACVGTQTASTASQMASAAPAGGT